MCSYISENYENSLHCQTDHMKININTEVTEVLQNKFILPSKKKMVTQPLKVLYK